MYSYGLQKILTDHEPYHHNYAQMLSALSTCLLFMSGFYQGWDDPYVPRTHEGLLKWKYPEMNSVDFHFEVV